MLREVGDRQQTMINTVKFRQPALCSKVQPSICHRTGAVLVLPLLHGVVLEAFFKLDPCCRVRLSNSDAQQTGPWWAA